LLLGNINLPPKHHHGPDQPATVAIAPHQSQELTLKAISHLGSAVNGLGIAQAG
jgi:hypothetical protein